MGNIFVRCHVENASYGLTLCTERAVIAAAVAQESGGNMQLRAIAEISTPG